MTEAINYDPIIKILEDTFGEVKNHNEFKGQISFDCPVCSHEIAGMINHTDGKGNLEINYFKKVYKCWACSETHHTHGSIFSLVYKYATSQNFKEFNLYYPNDEGQVHYVFNKVRLPKEFISIKYASDAIKRTHYYKQAFNYLKSRNITDSMIDVHNIGFCYQGEYAHRIIIPSYNSADEINYFVGRSYLSKPYIKYKNPESQKEEIIWNLHLIDWSKPVYIVEGVFDSIFLPNSIPILGKKMSEKLHKLIYEMATEIIIVLDGDAWADTEKLFHVLNCGKLFGKVRAIKLPVDKDIAELKGNISNYKKIKLD